MISSLTNRGTLRFMVYDGALTAATFLVFLRRLVQGAERKLFVIVDNLRVHRAKRVTAWAKANAARIELFYLPPYAPEHNPDEFLNNDVKQAMARQPVPRDKASLKAGLTSYMRRLQRRPPRSGPSSRPPPSDTPHNQSATYLMAGLVANGPFNDRFGSGQSLPEPYQGTLTR